MRLYRMELYKLFHKKTVIIAGGISLVWLLFYFVFLQVYDRSATINGVTYHGFEAIKHDREITEEFTGRFTDETAETIVQKYGFPGKVVENYGYWQDANYLNGFVTDYLSDGYLNGWAEGEYKKPEQLVPLEETELGAYLKAAGEEEDGFLFGYTKGWAALLDFLQNGLVFAGVWTLMCIAPVFAQERQVKTENLILTTENGKKKTLQAKLAAGLTAALIAYACVVLLGFLLAGSVFGLSGGTVRLGIAYSYISTLYGAAFQPVAQFTFFYLLAGLAALLTTAAITLWVSVKCKTAFSAVIIGFGLWYGPFLLTFFRGIFYLLARAQPLMTVFVAVFIESCHMYSFNGAVLAAEFGLCMLLVCKGYGKTAKE